MRLNKTLLVWGILTASGTYALPPGASPLANYSTAWNAPKYQTANTAKNASYLAPKEKELIYLLNLARMDPVLFAQTVLPKAASDAQSSYYQSLLKQLLEMKPQPLLSPDSLCWVSARCHALSSGVQGYDGHERITEECSKKEHYMGECCHYGSDNPLDILVRLLVDEGIPSLGHRKICLGNFQKVGISIQPHSVYRNNAVLDFY